MGYFLAPALFFMAHHSPDRVVQEKDIRDIRLLAVNEYIQHRKMIEAMRQDISHKYNNYTSSVAAWLSIDELAEKIVSHCPGNEISKPVYSYASLTEEKRRIMAEYQAKDRYINEMNKPCRSAPENLNKEYIAQTLQVASSFSKLDNYLIRSAINALQNEHEFVFSPDTILRSVNFSMQTYRGAWRRNGIRYDNVIHVSLVKTELISVRRGYEERIYVLQGIGDNVEGYKFFRVDHDIRQFIDAGILDYKNFGINYEFANYIVKANDDTFSYSITTDDRGITGKDGDIQSIVDFISLVHLEKVYTSLYNAGDIAADLQNKWGVVKNIISYYDCVEDITSINPLQNLRSCLLDAVSLIDGFGQGASLSKKFGMELARGLPGAAATSVKDSISALAKNTSRELSLSSTSELTSPGKNALRSIDPGFELMTLPSRSMVNRIVSQLASNGMSSELARHIVSLGVIDKLPSVPSDKPQTALLPGSEISVPVKAVGNQNGREVYVLFNPETGEAFGKRYLRDGKQLRSLDNEQLKQVGRKSP